MSTPQSAICAEGETFGLFLTLLVEPGSEATIRRALAELPGLTRDLAAQQGEPALSSAVGIGAEVWERLCGPTRPAELVPFAPLADGPRLAPATPADLFLHLHSDSHAANFALARAVRQRLGGAVRVVEEIAGFRTLGGRDLTGFVDGTENPKGKERPKAAIVGAEDPAFIGGSYVSLQRYVHRLSQWEALPVTDQELAVGRTKADDQEIDDKPASAHIARVVIEEDGEELQILRHSLPYGTTSENGLYFVAYGRSPRPFRRMLEAMVRRDAGGQYDRLLDYTSPVTGAAFFCPSIEWLEGLSENRAR
jgi:putative iron-dependent peroxidase